MITFSIMGFKYSENEIVFVEDINMYMKIVVVSTFGGWCRATGNKVQKGEPLYYLKKTEKSPVCYTYSEAALKKA